MTMWQLFWSHRGRSIHKWPHYLPIYERHLARFAGRSPVVYEIGVSGGGSLQLWKRYFGPNATIVGIDIDPACASMEERQISVRIGDQSDQAFLADVVSEFGPPDIVIDDGSHMPNHMWASFSYLYPVLTRDGVYLVEDLHCSYWTNFDGGLGREGTFVERAKQLIDELNGPSAAGAIPVTEFSRTTWSIAFYDSVAIFEKGTYPGERYDVYVGGDAAPMFDPPGA
jgi:hypothetical protein